MAITTPSMGLKRWDQPNDVFSYTELSDNFNLLDLHDHSSGKGVQIPTAGLANLAVDTTKLANNAVTDAKIAAGTITTARLASPDHGIYRNLLQSMGTFQGGQVVNTWLMGANALVASGSNTASGIPLFPWTAAHYAVAGKTTMLRVNVSGATNTNPAGITFTFGLYSIGTIAGGAGTINYGIGLVAGSTVAFASPAASSKVQGASADFSAPADGLYALAVNITVSPGASHMSSWTALLQVHHV
jgi:hypothetical protein